MWSARGDKELDSRGQFGEVPALALVVVRCRSSISVTADIEAGITEDPLDHLGDADRDNLRDQSVRRVARIRQTSYQLSPSSREYSSFQFQPSSSGGKNVIRRKGSGSGDL